MPEQEKLACILLGGIMGLAGGYFLLVFWEDRIMTFFDLVYSKTVEKLYRKRKAKT